MQRTLWSKNDIEYLKDVYHSCPLSFIVQRLNRTEKAIKRQAEKLGLYLSNKDKPRWTEEEIFILQENHTKPISELSKLIPNHTEIAITGKLYYIGLYRTFRPPKFNGLHSELNNIQKRQNYIVYKKVVENKIKRKIQDGEIIHHIDMNHGNNDPKNLHLCANRSDHMKAHASLNRLVRQLLDINAIYFDEVEGIYKIKN